MVVKDCGYVEQVKLDTWNVMSEIFSNVTHKDLTYLFQRFVDYDDSESAIVREAAQEFLNYMKYEPKD